MSSGYSIVFLSRDDVESVNLPMANIIHIVEDALIEKAHGRVQMPSKHWMERGTERWFAGMSSLVPKVGYAAMKWQSGSEENTARGLPYLTGLLFLNSLDDGLVVSVMDSTWITQQRTAAASAVAVKHLANPTERCFGVLGAGVQARSHLDALKHVMLSLEQVVIYDVNPEASSRFADVVSGSGLTPVIVHSARDVFDQSSVLVTCGRIRPDAQRLIDADWIRPGLTAVSIDYDCYWMGAGLAAVDCLFTDDIDQIEHIKPYRYFTDSPPFYGELGDVVAGLRPGRRDSRATIAVMNMGVAVEDVGTAKAIYDLAKERGIGVRLEV